MYLKQMLIFKTMPDSNYIHHYSNAYSYYAPLITHIDL